MDNPTECLNTAATSTVSKISPNKISRQNKSAVNALQKSAVPSEDNISQIQTSNSLQIFDAVIPIELDAFEEPNNSNESTQKVLAIFDTVGVMTVRPCESETSLPKIIHTTDESEILPASEIQKHPPKSPSSMMPLKENFLRMHYLMKSNGSIAFDPNAKENLLSNGEVNSSEHRNETSSAQCSSNVLPSEKTNNSELRPLELSPASSQNTEQQPSLPEHPTSSNNAEMVNPTQLEASVPPNRLDATNSITASTIASSQSTSRGVTRNNQPSPHYCTVCDLNFRTRNNLRKHKISQQHKNAVTNSGNIEGEAKKNHVSGPRCVVCHVEFRRKKFLRKHYSTQEHRAALHNRDHPNAENGAVGTPPAIDIDNADTNP